MPTPSPSGTSPQRRYDAYSSGVSRTQGATAFPRTAIAVGPVRGRRRHLEPIDEAGVVADYDAGATPTASLPDVYWTRRRAASSRFFPVLFDPIGEGVSMKAFASILMAAGALFTASGSAGASLPEIGAVLDLSSSTVAAGTSYQANFLRCESGETVTFVTENVDMEPVSATCGGVEPGASATLTAPTLNGSYTITATGSTSGESASATLTVTGGEGIPATGSSSAPIVLIGGGLVAFGAVLAFVGGGRRRHKASTT
jgi:hypothetical protein